MSYGQMILNILIGLVYTPIMVKLLGQSEYGLYQTVASTVSMLFMLNLGFSSSYVRFFAQYKKNDDRESIWKLNGLFLIIFMILGAIALVCGLLMSFNLTYVFGTGLTSTEYEIATVLFVVLTIDMAISFPMTVFSCIILANEKFVFFKLLGMIKTVISPLLTLPLLLLGYGSIAMVVATTVITIATDIIYLVYVLGKMKYRFVFHGFEKGLLRSLLVYTAFIALNIIIDQVNSNVGKVLLGRLQNTSAVAIYSIGYSLYSYYMTISLSISGVFTPRIHNIVNATRDDRVLQKARLTEIFVKVGRIQFLILALFATGIIFFGKTFIVTYWLNEEYALSYYITLLLVLSASIEFIQNIGIEIQRALDLHRFRGIMYVVTAFINLTLSVIFIRRIGVLGAPIGFAISFVVFNGIIINIYYHKRCNINIWAFWKAILTMSKGLLIPIMCGILIVNLVPMDSIVVFLLMMVLYSGIYIASMWFLGMNDSEKSLIKKPVEKFWRRHNS